MAWIYMAINPGPSGFWNGSRAAYRCIWSLEDDGMLASRFNGVSHSNLPHVFLVGAKL